ncbi:MAG TPA: GTP cyclohydrolase II [Aquabacterium sp.]|nr:GTP cyclohydrolase II [Aquabacterium sp.]
MHGESISPPANPSEQPSSTSPQVQFVAQARIPTRYGTFSMKVFQEQGSGVEHVAMVMGDIAEHALIRIHSECMTGDVFGSLRCDCGPQLDFAMREIGQNGNGIVLYLRQEGRGIGLINKLKAYELQDQGLDTVEANLKLGFPADLRKFDIAGQMLEYLGVKSVNLMTNNPDKIAALKAYGIAVDERVPVRSDAQAENERYLATKLHKLGHQIDWL